MVVEKIDLIEIKNLGRSDDNYHNDGYEDAYKPKFLISIY